MGNSLSQDSQAILEAATAGDAHLLKQQIACEPKLLQSVTLVKRRGVLHLAAKQGHPQVISTVLDPLLEAVREEYFEHIQTQRRQQRREQQQQEQQQQEQHSQQQQPQQQPEQQQQQQASQPQHSDAHDAAGARPAQQQQQASSQQASSQQASRSASARLAEPSTVDVQLPSFKRLRHTVNARDLYRRTPLIVAAKQGHLECTHLLVDAASNLFAVDREGNTSLHYAALHGHGDVVEYLLQRAADRGLDSRLVNKRNLSGFTALHYAVWSCRTAVVVPLLAAGADICAANDRVFDAWVPVPIGSTPLHLAVMRASNAIALLLLQHYVMLLTQSPSSRTRPPDPRTLMNLYGMNPAQLAAHRSNRQMAQLLLPSVSLSRLMSVHVAPPARVFGPPSLKSLAAAVLQRTLTQKLDSLEAAAAQAAAEQEHAAPAAAGNTCNTCCSKGSAGSCPCRKAKCSVVCVRACSTEEIEAEGSSTMLSPASSSSAAEFVVVHAGFSGTTTPASSRAVSPDVAAAEEDEGCASPAAVQASRRASSSPAKGKYVKFSTAEAAGNEQEEEEGCGGAATTSSSSGSSPLQHALTTASSSGWYDELCSVCWESEVTAVMEPCMHALCLACARQLVSSNGTAGATCPLCRGYIAGFGAVPQNSRQQTNKKKKCLLAGAGI